MDWLKNLGGKVRSMFSGGRRDEEEERRRQQRQQRQVQQQRVQTQRPQPVATQSPFGLRNLGQPTQPKQPILNTPSIKGLELKATKIQTPPPQPTVRAEPPQSPLHNPATKSSEETMKRVARAQVNNDDRNKAFQRISRTGDIKIDAPRAHQESLRIADARRKSEARARQQASLNTVPFQAVRGTLQGTARTAGTLPGSAVQLLGTVGKVASPDDTSIDKFFESLRTRGRGMNESVNKSLDKSFGSGQGKVGIAHKVGQGVGQIGADIATGGVAAKVLGIGGKALGGLSGARGATGIIGARYGAEEANEQFDQAKKAGKDDLYSGGIATGAGLTTAALEKVGLDKLLKPGSSNILLNASKRFLTEGAQEGAQEFGSNAWEKYGYNDKKELMDGVGEAALVGGLTGSVTSPGIDYMNNRSNPEAGPTNQRQPQVEAERAIEDAQRVPRSNNMPQSQAEVQATIDNGVITPATRLLSIDQKIQLLENSALSPNKDIRYREPDSTMNTLNPTGTVMTDYNPQARASARLGTNMTTLADTAGQSPDSMVTVYRGVPEGAEGVISPGDFITTNAQLAQDYAGGGRVVQEQVRFGDIIDDRTESLGEEYIFRPGADRELSSDVRHRELEERIALGLESGTISPEQAQALQLENARMFGETSDTLEFVDGVQGNDNALGATIDNLDDSSTIQLDNRQDDRTAQDTYFHEAVHKVLNDYSTTQERAQVIQSYIDDKLIDVNSVQLREGETINDAIEERVAEDFIDYVADMKSKQSRGNRLTRAVRNFFDTVFKRFQQDVLRRAQGGTLDPAYKKLYEDLYDGVYAKRDVQDKSLRAGGTAKSLQLEETISNLQQAFDNERNSATRDAISRDIATLQQELNTERKTSGRVASPAHRSVRHRSKPAVSSDDISSNEVNISKTDFNNALEEIVYTRNQKLMEREQLLQAELENLPVTGGAIRPEDARRVFGSNYGEFMPRHQIRKDAVEMDVQAQEQGFSDMDEYADFIRRPYDIRKELDDIDMQVHDLYRDKSIREEAKLLAEVRAHEAQESVTAPNSEYDQAMSRYQQEMAEWQRQNEARADGAESMEADMETKREIYELEGQLEDAMASGDMATAQELDYALSELKQESEGLPRPIEPKREDFIKKSVKPIDKRTKEKPSPEKVIDQKIDRNRKMGSIDEVIDRGFESGPRVTIDEMVDFIKDNSDLKRKQIIEMIHKRADSKGVDISTGRPISIAAIENPDLSITDAEGNMKSYKEIQAAATRSLKQVKLQGVESAVESPVSSESVRRGENVRQMQYKDENGNVHYFFEWRNPGHRKWHRVGETPIKSVNDSIRTSELHDDVTINKEAIRAHESGEAFQYIWRENDEGTGSPFVSEFDVAVGDGTKTEAGKPKVDPNKLATFDPTKHYIESGKVVVAKTGQILGNYVEITPDNVKIASGSQLISFDPRKIDLTNLQDPTATGSGITLTTQEYLRRSFGNTRNFKGIKKQLEHIKGSKNSAQEILTDLMVRSPQKSLLNMAKDKEVINTSQEYHEKKVTDAAKGLSKKKFEEMQLAVVYLIEPARPKPGEPKPPSYDKRLEEFRKTWGDDITNAVDQKNKFQRSLYDNLLTRLNIERQRLGKQPIPRRNDYISHTAQMLDEGIMARAKSLLDTINNPTSGDVAGETRGALPARIAGRTSKLRPKMRYNPSEMKRIGDNKPKDPDTPFRLYVDTALENIHMAQPVTEMRTMETFIRAMSQGAKEHNSPAGIDSMRERIETATEAVRNGKMKPAEATELRNKLFGLTQTHKNLPQTEQISKLLNKLAKDKDATLKDSDKETLVNSFGELDAALHEKSKNLEEMQKGAEQADQAARLVTFIQEHANKFAGKTNPLSRALKDSYGFNKGVETALRMAQQHAALSSIVGNMSSTIAQVLNMPLVVATTPVGSQAYGLQNMTNTELIKKSDAMMLRYNKASIRKPTKFSKAMEKLGFPLEFVEKHALQAAWAMKYDQGIKRGLNEKQAIDFADTFVNDTTSFRDAAQQAKVYDNAFLGAGLQYTREVTQQYRGILNTMDNKQKAQWMVANAVLLTATEALTGRKMGMDPLSAALESMLTTLGGGEGEDEENIWDKAKKISQIWTAELFSAVPMVSSLINNLIPKDQRITLFGEDSDFGRFDSGLAFTTPMINLIKAISNASKGEVEIAAKDALKLLPAGSQINKSVTGLQAMIDGYTKTSTGNIRTAVDKSNPANWVLAALFGPNAIIEQRKSFSSEKSLGKDNSDIAKELKGEDRKEFVDAMSEAKGTNAGSAMPSFLGKLSELMGGDTTSASDSAPVLETKSGSSERASVDPVDKAEFTKSQAKAKAKVLAGDWKMKDGVYVDKDGKPIKDYYKAKAKALKGQESSKAYEAWAYGYGLKTKSDSTKSKTGVDSLDRLMDADPGSSEAGKSNATKAMNLLLGKNGLDEVPDFVKDRFYKEAGFTKNDVAYRAMTTAPAEARLDEYKRIANEGDKKKLLDELHNGRRMAIGTGYMMAQDKIITQLRDEGLITKDEAKVLKSYKLKVEDGKLVPTGDSKVAKSGGGSRGGGGGGRGAKAKEPAQLYSASDIKNFMGGGNSDVRSSLLRIASGSTPSMSVGKVRARRATTRKYRGTSSNRRKTSKTAIG